MILFFIIIVIALEIVPLALDPVAILVMLVGLGLMVLILLGLSQIWDIARDLWSGKIVCRLGWSSPGGKKQNGLLYIAPHSRMIVRVELLTETQFQSILNSGVQK